MSNLAPLLETAKVARLLGVEVETLGAWRRKGYGPRWYKIGKKIKYAESDIRGWMNAQACGDISGYDCGRASLEEIMSQPHRGGRPANRVRGIAE